MLAATAEADVCTIVQRLPVMHAAKLHGSNGKLSVKADSTCFKRSAFMKQVPALQL